MAGVTISDLRDYRHLVKEIRLIDEELEWVYFPVASPNGKESGTFSKDPGDPTVRAVKKAEKLRKLRASMVKKVEAVDQWLEELEDHQLASVCRARYVLGRPWAEISMKICGSDNISTARMIVTRHFGTS